MNGTAKWEYSTIRDMQNRIRLLEMDNELMKSQMLSYSHDIRQAFMDMADRIDRMETKLTHLIQFEKGHSTNIMFPMFHIPHVENADGPEHLNGFDAMSCVETVMESCTDLRQTMLGGNSDDGKKISDAVLKSLDNIHSNNIRKRSMETESPSSPKQQKSFGLEAEARRRYDCNVCGKTFSQSSGLSRHHKIHVRRQQDIQNGIQSERLIKPKRFFCSHPGCQSSFTSRSGMTKHMRHFHRENRGAVQTAGTSIFNLSRAAQVVSAVSNNAAAAATKPPQVQHITTLINNSSSMEDSTGLSDGGTSQENSPASDDAVVSDDDEFEESRPRFTPIPVRYQLP